MHRHLTINTTPTMFASLWPNVVFDKNGLHGKVDTDKKTHVDQICERGLQNTHQSSTAKSVRLHAQDKTTKRYQQSAFLMLHHDPCLPRQLLCLNLMSELMELLFVVTDMRSLTTVASIERRFDGRRRNRIF
jgi:hypothetical protein